MDRMLKEYFLDKDELQTFVQRLIGKYEVLGMKLEDGELKYSRINSVDELRLPSSHRPLVPPKKWFYPERETLFTYRISRGRVKIEDSLKKLLTMKRIFFGMRPCDVRSLHILDKILLGRFHDPYYGIRRENTLIIELTCNEPAEYCFCTMVGGGPYVEDGCDVIFTRISEGFLVETRTVNGAKLIENNKDIFRKAREEEIIERNEIIARAYSKIEARCVDLERLYNTLVRIYDSDMWNDYSEKCFSCGKCNFICPTCHCFDIYDEVDANLSSGARVRIWDSCHFLSFTRVAGGIVFRRERTSRVKQRIYHKLCYSIDEIGEISCVGCGRCIEVCPSKIDVREIIAKLEG